MRVAGPSNWSASNVDSCNPDTVTCEHEPVSVPTMCEVAGEVGGCALGECATLSCQGLDCDDGDPCTLDACFSSIGVCVTFAAPGENFCEIEGVFGTCQDGLCNLANTPTGDARLSVEVAGLESNLVTYNLTCGGNLNLSGVLSRAGERWEASLTLPAGQCSLQVLARDANGEVVCEGTQELDILPATTLALDLVLTCAA